MERNNRTKIKLVKMLEILRRETDEDNPITTPQLISKITEEGIPCDRRTVYADIKALNDNGFEVISVTSPGKPSGYYVADRSFDLPEIRILMDVSAFSCFN